MEWKFKVEIVESATEAMDHLNKMSTEFHVEYLDILVKNEIECMVMYKIKRRID